VTLVVERRERTALPAIAPASRERWSWFLDNDPADATPVAVALPDLE
jgi:hypothetical protein